MSLQIWLPLNGNLDNQGLSGVKPTISSPIYSNGKIGQCLLLDKQIDTTLPFANWDYVTNSCSFGCWVKVSLADLQTIANGKTFDSTNSTMGGTLLGKDSYGGVALRWKTNNLSSSKTITQVTLYGHIRNTNSNSQVTNSYVLPFDTWTHVVLVINRSTQTMGMYINGKLFNEKGIGGVTGTFSTGNFLICQSSWDGGNGVSSPGKFSLNDVRVYDHTLSAKEVKELAKGLVLHYRLAGPGGMNMISDFDTSFNTIAVGTITLFNNQMNGGTQEVLSSFANKNKVVHFHSNGGDNRMYRYYTVTKGKSYTVSFDYYSTSTHTSALHCELNGGNYNWLGSNCAYSTPGVWKRLSATYTNITSNALLYIFVMCNANADCYIKNIKLEEGPIATPWIPNSADPLYSALGYNNNIEYDCSGYRRNGTKSGTITWDIDSPRYTTSYKFNGSSCIKNNQFYFDSNIWTVSLWYKCNTAPTDWETIICLSKNDGSDSNKKIGIMLNPNRIWFKAEDNSMSMSSLKIGEWCHLAIVSNGTSATIYENGIQKGTTTMSSSVTDAYDLVIGARASSAGASTTSYYNKGNISDVRIYTTALSAEDIAELYHSAVIVDNTGKSYAYEYFEA